MLTHSQKRVLLDELNHIRVGYNAFAAVARKRYPESTVLQKARQTIKRLEKTVQRHADKVEKFRKGKEEQARKLRAVLCRSIEFDDVKTVQAHMKRYVDFVAGE